MADRRSFADDRHLRVLALVGKVAIMPKYKRIIKYICYAGLGNFLTGDIDEQTLIYEQLDWNRWVLRYLNLKRGRVSSGSIEESENQTAFGSLPADRIVERFSANDVSALIVPSPSYGDKALVIRGAFDYESDDALKDDFAARIKLKDQLMDELRQAFDKERERIRREHERLDELLKGYEHLPIKG
jgi:hypothetical protein